MTDLPYTGIKDELTFWQSFRIFEVLYLRHCTWSLESSCSHIPTPWFLSPPLDSGMPTVLMKLWYLHHGVSSLKTPFYKAPGLILPPRSWTASLYSSWAHPSAFLTLCWFLFTSQSAPLKIPQLSLLTLTKQPSPQSLPVLLVCLLFSTAPPFLSLLLH